MVKWYMWGFVHKPLVSNGEVRNPVAGSPPHVERAKPFMI